MILCVRGLWNRYQLSERIRERGKLSSRAPAGRLALLSCPYWGGLVSPSSPGGPNPTPTPGLPEAACWSRRDSLKRLLMAPRGEGPGPAPERMLAAKPLDAGMGIPLLLGKAALQHMVRVLVLTVYIIAHPGRSWRVSL